MYSWEIRNASDKVFDISKRAKSFADNFKQTLFDIKIDRQDANFVKISWKFTHLAAIDKFNRLFICDDNTEECLDTQI